MLPQFCRREEPERFPQPGGWEFDLLHSGFAFLSWLIPRTQGKGITRPKVARLPESAEFTDLQGDSEEEECSLNQAASMALPASWYRWQFSGTQKDLYSARKIRAALRRIPEDVPAETSGSITQNRARFRVCAFSTAGSIVSLRDVLLRRAGQPQPNCTP